jgi:hypothetical protein
MTDVKEARTEEAKERAKQKGTQKKRDRPVGGIVLPRRNTYRSALHVIYLRRVSEEMTTRRH